MKRNTMTLMEFVKPVGAVVALLGFAGLSVTSARVHAEPSETDSTVQLGFAIAPVKLNLNRNRAGVTNR